MDNQYDQIMITVGYDYLFGTKPTLKEIVEIISKYPASVWLDLLTKVEAFLVRPAQDFDPQTFLSKNLFPPSTLSLIERKKDKRVSHCYFSLGQINLLRKLAIAYGSNGTNQEIPKVEISKVFLMAHDLHNRYDDVVGKSSDLESFTKFIIRNGYLNANIDFLALFTRTYEMYTEQAKEITIYPETSFADFFSKNTGITIEEVISLGLALATPLFQDKEILFGQTTTINIGDYFEQTSLSQEKINSIIENLIINFSKAKEKILKELENIDLASNPIGYSLEVFRKTPLIRLGDGRLVCANFSCLIQKITENIIWLPLIGVKKEDRNKVVNDLTEYRGHLFEKYIKDICSVFAEKNNNIHFIYIPPESREDNEEVGDAILVQGTETVILEAKSRQFKEEFKSTGDWEKDKSFMNGFIKKSVNQIEIAAKKIIDGKIENFPLEPKNITKIYPIIIAYESIPTHAKMQRFIRQKIHEAGFFKEQIFAPLEIVHIDDLERTADISDTITMIDLLKEKNADGIHAEETNFHNFLSMFLINNKLVSNGWLRKKSDKIWGIIKKTLNFK